MPANGRGSDAAPGVSVPCLQRRLRVAQGEEPGDLLLRGGLVVNVFTRQIVPGTVVVADGWIAGVGPHAWEARETIDLAGQVVLPGLIDSHMHLESALLMPAELARLIVPHGTTTTISDSHEIGNVLGMPGIDFLLSASVGLAFDLFLTASSCVPATEWEDAGAVLGPAEVRQLLERPRVLGLAEMMDMPAVARGKPRVLEKIQAALECARPLDGHAPGLAGLALMGYVAAGMRSDHESSSVEEAREKAALGMLVQVREGSIAHNLEALLPLLVSGELGDDWTLVTDDILADDLRSRGHVDALVRRVIAAGVPAADAIRHTTLIPARHYRLFDRGAVAPGYRADLVVVRDLADFEVTRVFKDGRLVAGDGQFLAQSPVPPSVPPSTVHLAPLDESAFHLTPSQEQVPVIRVIPGSLLTRAETHRCRQVEGRWAFDPAEDVLLIASIERHRATGRIGLGLVAGFGFRKKGALASSVAHDSHNLIVTGTDPRNMLACVRAVQEMGGGFALAVEGQVVARLPLPVAGLLSTSPGVEVCRQLRDLRQAARLLGCELPSPEGTLSFLALPVIPELRITDQGLFDVCRQRLIRP